METYLCCGNNYANFICKNKICNIKNPFLCELWRVCSCRIHFHNQQCQFIGIKRFKESKSIIETNNLNQSRIELQNLFQKLEIQFKGVLTEAKQKILKQIQDYQTNNSLIDKDIYREVFVNKESFSNLTGNQAQQILKATQKPNKNEKSITILFKPFEIELKNHFKNYADQFQDRVNSYTKQISQIHISKPQEQFPIISNADAQVKQFRKLVDKNFQLNLKSVKNNIKLEKILLSRSFQDLTVLQIQSCNIASQSLRFFTKYQNPSLKILALLFIPNLTNTIKFIVQASLPNLVQFKAFGSDIGDQDCIVLTLANWPKIGYFNLHSNKITSMGAKFLIQKYSNKLWRLDLDHNQLDDQCKEIFLKSQWTNLTEIHLTNNSFSLQKLMELNIHFKNNLKVKKVFIG